MFVFDVFLCLYDVIYDVTNPLQNMEIEFLHGIEQSPKIAKQFNYHVIVRES